MYEEDPRNEDAAAYTSGSWRWIQRIFGPMACDVSAMPPRSNIGPSPNRSFSQAISSVARVSMP